jgi:hypothetical protein
MSSRSILGYLQLLAAFLISLCFNTIIAHGEASEARNGLLLKA